MPLYIYKQKLQKNKLQQRHLENIVLLQEELREQKAEMLQFLDTFQRMLCGSAYAEHKDRQVEIDTLLGKQDYLMTGNTIFDIIVNQKRRWAGQYGVHYQSI